MVHYVLNKQTKRIEKEILDLLSSSRAKDMILIWEKTLRQNDYKLQGILWIRTKSSICNAVTWLDMIGATNTQIQAIEF